MFHFRLWHFGEVIDVVIDDRLPTHNGKLIFIHSNDECEFWSALLEKAYAKYAVKIASICSIYMLTCRLYGSYESLRGGKTSEAMEDFTGGIVETFDLTKADNNLFKMIEKYVKKASLMSSSIALVAYVVASADLVKVPSRSYTNQDSSSKKHSVNPQMRTLFGPRKSVLTREVSRFQEYCIGTKQGVLITQDDCVHIKGFHCRQIM